MLLLGGLPLRVRWRRWTFLGWLCGLRVDGRGRWSLFTDRLAIVVSDHHDDGFGFLGSDDLARHLRPLALEALIVTTETGLGAMFANDADFGLLGKGIFERVGRPVSVCITHHHDLDDGIPARRAWRRVRVIRGLLPPDFSGPFLLAGGPFSLTIIPVAPLAITPEAPIGIVRLPRIWIVLLLLAPAR